MRILIGPLAVLVAVLGWHTTASADEVVGKIIALNAANESLTIETDDGEHRVFEGEATYGVRPMTDPPPDPVAFDDLEIGQRVAVIYEEGERYRNEAVEIDETPSTPPAHVPPGADAADEEQPPVEDVD